MYYGLHYKKLQCTVSASQLKHVRLYTRRSAVLSAVLQFIFQELQKWMEQYIFGPHHFRGDLVFLENP
jgi:hypothetical protein